MNKKVNIFLAVATAIAAMIAIFVLFAPMFYNTILNESKGGSEFGSVFQVMFYGYNSSDKPTNGVPLLIVAFALECVAFIGGFVTLGFAEKKQAIAFAVNALVLIAAGVIFLFGKQLYIAANGEFSAPLFNTTGLRIGTGPICSAVFALLGGVLSLYGAYSTFKD